MAITFNQMVAEAVAEVPVISPAEAATEIQEEPRTLVIDVRDAVDFAEMGIIPGARAISLGSLTYKADHELPEEWRDPELADHDRPIIITCVAGPLGAISGKLLKDMGFTKVRILEGGVQAWLDAGLPTEHFDPCRPEK